MLYKHGRINVLVNSYSKNGKCEGIGNELVLTTAHRENRSMMFILATYYNTNLVLFEATGYGRKVIQKSLAYAAMLDLTINLDCSLTYAGE